MRGGRSYDGNLKGRIHRPDEVIAWRANTRRLMSESRILCYFDVNIIIVRCRIRVIPYIQVGSAGVLLQCNYFN